MFFDGLGNMFGALGFEPIPRKIERRQRPLGGVIIGISINNSSRTRSQIELKMVSIEPQRTHIHFDGLGDMFGALSVEVILGKIEGRQCPIILEITANNERAFDTETLAADVELGDGFVTERHGAENLHHGLSFDQSNDLVHVLDGNVVAADIQTRQRRLDGGVIQWEYP